LARRSDAELDALVAELESIDKDLELLAPAANGEHVEPGRIATQLATRRGVVAASIKARKRVAFGVISEAGADLADRALTGDPGALAELVSVIRSCPLAFEAGLADQVVLCMADALSEAGAVFVSLL
jgi:hypothetical protein